MNPTTNGFVINWTPGAAADSHLLDVSTEPDFSAPVMGYDGLPVVTPPHQVTGLEQGADYYARIRAVNTFGETPSNTLAVTTVAAFICPAGAPTLENSVDFNSYDEGVIGGPFYSICTDGVGPSFVYDNDSATITEDYESYMEGDVFEVAGAVGSIAAGEQGLQYSLRLDPAGGIVDTDFGEYTAGVAPSDWTSLVGAVDTQTVVDSAEATSGKLMEFTGPAGNARQWTPSLSGTAVIDIRFKRSGTDYSAVYFRAVSASQWFVLDMLATATRFVGNIGGVFLASTNPFVVSAGVWHRAEIRLLQSYMEARVWVDGDPRPGGAMLSMTYNQYPTGRVAFRCDSPTTMSVDYLNITHP